MQDDYLIPSRNTENAKARNDEEGVYSILSAFRFFALSRSNCMQALSLC